MTIVYITGLTKAPNSTRVSVVHGGTEVVNENSGNNGDVYEVIGPIAPGTTVTLTIHRNGFKRIRIERELDPNGDILYAAPLISDIGHSEEDQVAFPEAANWDTYGEFGRGLDRYRHYVETTTRLP